MISGPTTEIEIISNAVMLCGKAPFSTIDDGGEFALSAQALYNQKMPSLMSQPHWRFNMKIQQLQQIANFDPDFQTWQYAWQLPSDYLSFETLDPIIDYQIFGERVYTRSGSPLKLSYRTQLPVSKWPVYFREYAVYELAVGLAFSVAESDGLEAKLKQELVEIRAMAMFIDAQNHPNVPIQNRPWISARAGWY